MPPNKVSLIWNYFKVQGKDSICNECQKVILGQFPSNLRRHLRSQHELKFNEFMNSETEALKQPSGILKLKKESGESEFRRTLAKLYATTMMPEEIVNNEHFNKLVKRTCPSVDLLLKDTEILMSKIKKLLIQELNLAKFIHVCANIWTFKNSTVSYLTIDCHFFINVQKKTCNIGLVKINRHDNDTIKQVLNLLKKFNIDLKKITFVITGNANFMKKTFKPVKEISNEVIFMDIDDEEELEKTEALPLPIKIGKHWMRCGIHTLQRILNLLENNETFKCGKQKLSSIILNFSKSIKAKEELKKICSKSIFVPVPTNWNSTYWSMARFLEIFEDVSTVCNYMDWQFNLEKKWLKEIVNLLKPFYEATSKLEGDSVLLSKFVPTLLNLKNELTLLKNKLNNRDLKILVGDLIKDIDCRFNFALDPESYDFNPIFVMTSFLDPETRYYIPENLQIPAIAELKRQTLMNRQCKTEVDEIHEPPKKKSVLFPNLTENRTIQYKENEVDKYLKEEIADMDFFQFMTFLKSKYENIYVIAEKYLPCPPSSSNSERTFSIAELLSDKRQNKIFLSTLDAKIIATCNPEYVKLV